MFASSIPEIIELVGSGSKYGGELKREHGKRLAKNKPTKKTITKTNIFIYIYYYYKQFNRKRLFIWAGLFCCFFFSFYNNYYIHNTYIHTLTVI